MARAETLSVVREGRCRSKAPEGIIISLVIASILLPILSLWSQQQFQFEANAGRPFKEIPAIPADNSERAVVLFGKNETIAQQRGFLVIPIKDGSLFIRVELAGPDEEALKEAVREHRSRLLRDLGSALSQYRLADARKPGFRTALRTELKDRFSRSLRGEVLREVFVRDLALVEPDWRE